MNRIGVVWDPVFLGHVTDEGHPEHPRRLEDLYQRLQELSVARRFVTLAPVPAEEAQILTVHSPGYLAQVRATAKRSASELCADTLTCAQSWAVARLAAGSTIAAIGQVVIRRLDQALVLARPPGHHAEATRAMGYCIFNNVAIGAMVARRQLGLDRVAVVDWDLHHGNGTQHLFERDPSVFFLSSHQFPHYPGTGHFSETGLGPGEGTTLNIPLPKGCADAEFLAIYEQVVVPAVLAFAPQLILVSAGFDIHTDDPLGAMAVTPEGIAGLTRLMVDLADKVCGGRVVFCLEGGYEPQALADSVLAMLDELGGVTITDAADLAAGARPAKVKAIIQRCRHTHSYFWKRFRRQREQETG